MRMSCSPSYASRYLHETLEHGHQAVLANRLRHVKPVLRQLSAPPGVAVLVVAALRLLERLLPVLVRAQVAAQTGLALVPLSVGDILVVILRDGARLPGFHGFHLYPER